MEYSALPAPLRLFVDEVGRSIEATRGEREPLHEVGEAMRRLLRAGDWLDPELTQAGADAYRQYLLYADPLERFSVVSFVWGPGQRTEIHDHTVWGVVGILRGAERTQKYRVEAGRPPAPDGEEIVLLPGDVDLVSPAVGDVHEVKNALAEAVSVSIHAYGANIGKVRRHVFPRAGGPPREFVSGYSNAGD